jgi:hypothetical protein
MWSTLGGAWRGEDQSCGSESCFWGRVAVARPRARLRGQRDGGPFWGMRRDRAALVCSDRHLVQIRITLTLGQ